MKILHAFSNWKWTGPAEPAVRLASRLHLNHDVEFACGKCPYKDLDNVVAEAAKTLGLSVIDGLRLRKHFDPVTGMRDFNRLTQIIRDRQYDIVHTHLLNDHLLAGAAARRARSDSLVVRTVYGGPDVSSKLRTRIAFRRLTDGVIAASEAAAKVVREKTDVPDERLFVVAGAVDVDRLDPIKLRPLREAARRDLGFNDENMVVGVVARVQRQRRFDLLLQSFALAVKQDPRLRLVIVGRGSHIKELAHEPVEELGLRDHVVFTGYRAGPQYDAILSALDFGVYLVPGSDASCRAAREMAGACLPVIVTQRPPLPEIVEHEVTGMVVEEEVRSFSDAIISLASDRSRLGKMAQAARVRAMVHFSLGVQAEQTQTVYQQLLQLGPRSRK